MSSREEIATLVRRVRRRLEAVRLMKASARGALAGGAAGVVVLLVMKANPAWPVVHAVAWALLGAGALSGLLHAILLRKSVDPLGAALFVDRRLGTHERVVTVFSCPASPFTERAAAEIEAALPRFPFPREAALVPVALFSLFAAGLLPEAGAGARGTSVIGPVGMSAGASGTAATAPVEIPPGTLRELAKGNPPAAAERTRIEEAIERRLRRPEEREAAREALARAAEGDAEAAKEVARALEPRREENAGGVISVTAYPDAAEFVREYRRALGEEDQE